MPGKWIKVRSSEGGEFDCYRNVPNIDRQVPAVVLASAVYGVERSCSGHHRKDRFRPICDIDRIEIPQCSALLSPLCMLSFDWHPGPTQRPTSIQNNSDLPQGLAGRHVAEGWWR